MKASAMMPAVTRAMPMRFCIVPRQHVGRVRAGRGERIEERRNAHLLTAEAGDQSVEAEHRHGGHRAGDLAAEQRRHRHRQDEIEHRRLQGAVQGGQRERPGEEDPARHRQQCFRRQQHHAGACELGPPDPFHATGYRVGDLQAAPVDLTGDHAQAKEDREHRHRQPDQQALRVDGIETAGPQADRGRPAQHEQPNQRQKRQQPEAVADHRQRREPEQGKPCPWSSRARPATLPGEGSSAARRGSVAVRDQHQVAVFQPGLQRFGVRRRRLIGDDSAQHRAVGGG